MTTLSPIMAIMQITEIYSHMGYTVIQDDQILIPDKYNYSLHIIDLDQFRDMIQNIKSNIVLLNNSKSYTFGDSIRSLEDKLTTLYNDHHYTRSKRGLFNIIGTIDKWITGSMDNEDREIINNHLAAIDSKNDNLIKNNNKQVQINENFQKAILSLTKSINIDKNNIQEFINRKIDEAFLRLIIFEIKLNIEKIDKMLSELQDDIVFSNLNMIHPSILTHNEITQFQINADKMKLLHIGYTKTKHNRLIFLIKIPNNLITINKKLIVPIRDTQNCTSINTPITPVLEYNQVYYSYMEHKSLLQLTHLNHCTIYNTCSTQQSCNTDIEALNDNTLIIQQAHKVLVESTCDERKIEITGNFYINFNNCSVRIFNKTYSNTLLHVQNKYYISSIHSNLNNQIKLNDTKTNVLYNTNIMTETLDYDYNQISNTYNPILIVIIIILVILIICIICTVYHTQIKACTKIQEDLHPKGGRVIYSGQQAPIYNDLCTTNVEVDVLQSQQNAKPADVGAQLPAHRIVLA